MDGMATAVREMLRLIAGARPGVGPQPRAGADTHWAAQGAAPQPDRLATGRPPA
jgi:hypothetical protein